MSNFSKKRLKGFTIIEALVAIFILTVGFVAVTQIFPFNLKINKSSEMKTKAVQLAQAKIEEIVSKSYDEVSCAGVVPPCQQTENQTSEDIGFKRITSIKFADPQNNLQEPVPANTDTEIKKIEVTVSWRSTLKSGEDSIKVSTLISKR